MCEVNLNGWTTEAMSPTTTEASKVVAKAVTMAAKPTKEEDTVEIGAPTRALDNRAYIGDTNIRLLSHIKLAGSIGGPQTSEVGGGSWRRIGKTGKFSDKIAQNQIRLVDQRRQQQQLNHNMPGGLRKRGRPHKSYQIDQQHQIQLDHANKTRNNMTTEAMGQAQYQHTRTNHSHPEPMNLSRNKRSMFASISKQIQTNTSASFTPINKQIVNCGYSNQIEAFKVAALINGNSGTFQTTTPQASKSNSGQQLQNSTHHLEQIVSSFHPAEGSAMSRAYMFPPAQASLQLNHQAAPYGDLLTGSSKTPTMYLPATSNRPAQRSQIVLDKHSHNSSDTIHHHQVTHNNSSIIQEAALQQFANLHSLSAVASALQKQQQDQCQLHHLTNLAFIHRDAVSSGAIGTSIETTTTQTITTKTISQTLNKSTSKKIRELRKCRKVYGMERRHQWCTQCKWKKACSRFCDRRLQAAAVAAAAAATGLVTGGISTAT